MGRRRKYRKVLTQWKFIWGLCGVAKKRKSQSGIDLMYHRIVGIETSEIHWEWFRDKRNEYEPGKTKIYLNFCVLKFFANHFNHFSSSTFSSLFQFVCKVLSFFFLKHLIKQNFPARKKFLLIQEKKKLFLSFFFLLLSIVWSRGKKKNKKKNIEIPQEILKVFSAYAIHYTARSLKINETFFFCYRIRLKMR